MAKKARQRISYGLPLASSRPGHRLGINGLAIDAKQSILYSGGRDGSICAWDLNLNLKNGSPTTDPVACSNDLPSAKSCTEFRAQTQAHTHWVNDIVLAHHNTALISASSDLTVKVWRPWSESEGSDIPQTIGQHADYVKCLASPGPHADWVASGGLDRRICLWDINGAGKGLEIVVGAEDESRDKGSIYALSVGRNLLVSGGPESIVRLWDSRTGRRITKFVGHTDNVRDILIDETGDTVVSASSDQTVKVWSITAGRCMHTLTMHNDSVWALFSEDPQLGVFYSSDRSGLVVKTDVRGTFGEMDNGLSLAVAQENEGVSRLIACGGYIWTATSSSSLNRWADVDTGAELQLPEPFKAHRASSVSAKAISQPTSNGFVKRTISAKSILRISNTAKLPSSAMRDTDAAVNTGGRKDLDIYLGSDLDLILPTQNMPEETIEGQHGFIKHRIMNDKKRVLTLDTAGEVMLWDLLRCVPIKSFGKCHLDEIEPQINTMKAIAQWCSVDTRTGRLTVALDELNCFDAEMYADELQLDEPIEFREDQRINLGKWVLRHLFSNLIDEIIKRDEGYRSQLNVGVRKRRDAQIASEKWSIQMPSMPLRSWQDAQASAVTPRANGVHYPPMTPGMNIGIATPGPPSHLSGVPEDGASLNKQPSQASRTSTDRSGDYFSSTPLYKPETSAKAPTSPMEAVGDERSGTSSSEETNGNTNTLFGKKFRMGMSFGTKKRTASQTTDKPMAVDEKGEARISSSTDNGDHPRALENNLASVIQRIRNDYHRSIHDDPLTEVESLITPSLSNEAPLLKIPPTTMIMLQEETSGGIADLYRGTVGSVGEDARIIEARAPLWLGELLLRNKIPYKDPIKVSFTLSPWQDNLPSIAGPEGNTRLNANRMLRVKKILAYIAERLEALPENRNPHALKPGDYLELYCNDQKLSPTLTLGTLRAYIWKGGPDVALFYRSNERKRMESGKGLKSNMERSSAATSAVI